jgi:putative DNA methylase
MLENEDDVYSVAGQNIAKGLSVRDPIATLHPWFARTPRGLGRLAVFLTLTRLDDNAETLIERLSKPKIGEEDYRAAHDLICKQQSPPNTSNTNAPLVLDPFAGSGSIPLEALRLGCRAEACDINPLATAIARAVTVYPAQLAKPNFSSKVRWRGLSKEFRQWFGDLQADVHRRWDGVFGSHDRPLYHLWIKKIRCPNCGVLVPSYSSLGLNKKENIF